MINYHKSNIFFKELGWFSQVLGRTRVENSHKKKRRPPNIGTWFVVEDQDQPKMIEVHVELQRLSGLMHDVGNVP